MVPTSHLTGTSAIRTLNETGEVLVTLSTLMAKYPIPLHPANATVQDAAPSLLWHQPQANL